MENSGPRLISTDEGYSAEYLGRLLYSRKSAVARADGIADRAVLLPQTLVIIPSPILFHGVKRIVGRISPDSHILCLELDQKLMAFSLQYAPSYLLEHKQLSFVRSSDSAQILEFVKKLGLMRFRRIETVPVSGGYSLFRSKYDAIGLLIEQSIQQSWQNHMTLVHMSRLWIGNMLKNLSRNWQSIYTSLPSVNRPVVVAGAGESLEHSLPFLRHHRQRYYLLAVDTALPVLVESGMMPDAVLILESQIANSQDFINHKNKNLVCICDLTSHPSVLENISCTCHFFLSKFAEVAILSRLGDSGLQPLTLPALGSVGVAAVEIACRLTSAPVALTGLDFSYALGKPHSRGSPSHLLSLIDSRRENPAGWYAQAVERPIINVTGLDGKRIYSDMVLYSYGKTLSEIIRRKTGIYDMRRTGIPLAIENIDDQRLLEIFKPYPREAHECLECASGKLDISRDQIDGFFVREIKLLDDAMESIRIGRADLHRRLSPVDYVFVGFPDAQHWKSLDKNFLFRFLASAAEYRERFIRARKMLELTPLSLARTETQIGEARYFRSS